MSDPAMTNLPGAATAPAVVLETLQIAIKAQRQEYDNYTAAWPLDLEGWHAHQQAYEKACEVVTNAQKAVEGNILNTPQALQGLEALASANKRLSDSLDALAADAKLLNGFTTAANIVIHILGVIAVL